MKSAARRLALETVGWVLVVVGIAALVLPGPGLLSIFAGLVLLSQQYDWAEKRLEPVKEMALKAAEESVETWPRIFLSTLVAVAIIAAGVLWIWHPPAPSWWPVDEKWWLVGGWGTGSTQVASGLFAIGMIVYSYRRFREKADADA
jgi:hypothetical protein